ncbi:hypothetical protein SAMN05660284_02790 [Formivibrio citricus]|uniref:Uncharacterized protein n=1 Tax=Formivibrio citricus TaxID=83765 RepID=A0A1I5DZD1_9NEIS|nr:hypothetical protein SAMN05660284_02790 [Formivibrio citricus]
MPYKRIGKANEQRRGIIICFIKLFTLIRIVHANTKNLVGALNNRKKLHVPDVKINRVVGKTGKCRQCIFFQGCLEISKTPTNTQAKIDQSIADHNAKTLYVAFRKKITCQFHSNIPIWCV